MGAPETIAAQLSISASTTTDARGKSMVLSRTFASVRLSFSTNSFFYFFLISADSILQIGYSVTVQAPMLCRSTLFTLNHLH
mmetsp:Transcript_11519/g.31075  ORF Transcript_11519/g.31075 Transcript_11519/m.31075 type:complete len:82 (+) Transcript_11519:3102-3347(+)